MKTYKIIYAIVEQILFAIATFFLVVGIFSRSLTITFVSFAAKSVLRWMSVENNKLCKE